MDLSYFFEGNNRAFVDLIVKYYFLCWVFHALSAAVSSAYFPAYKEKNAKDDKSKMPTSLADKVNWDYTNASILYCIMIFYFYAAGVLDLQKHGLEGRWTMQTFNSTHGITLHIASSLYETTCYVFAKKDLVFYLHHAVTVLGCVTMLFFGRASYWCCLLGLVEGTNIPLGFVLGGPFRTTPAIKNSLAYKLNGMLLWVMYLVIRVPIPYVMYLLHKDVNKHGLGTGDSVAWVFDDASWNSAWVLYVDVVGLFLWGLSLMWFSQITRGMMKALGIGSTEAAEAKKTA